MSLVKAKYLQVSIVIFIALSIFFNIRSYTFSSESSQSSSSYSSSIDHFPSTITNQPHSSDNSLTQEEIINKYSSIQYQSLSTSKVNGCFVTLARNSDLWGLVDSIRSVQDRFNNKFNYDWIFFNDEEFTDEFKEVTSSLISGKTKYGKIPKEHWSFPENLDLNKAAKAREDLSNLGVIYAESVSYRHMCRFESGFFYKHPMLADYDWYWRVEPDIQFFCDINYDLFRYMADNNKVYGFAISIHEFEATISSLWGETKKFLSDNPQYIAKDNLLDFISDDGGATYNLCHFWSNFEIVNLSFFRSEAYEAYFQHLDATNNFFYERWGDAPIHSIAASLFLKKDEIHMFNDVGYSHSVYQNCPIDNDFRLSHSCACNPDNDFTFKGYSCSGKYFDVQGLKKPNNWEKYSD
ncbi:alpha-1,2-mannosyltransferase [Saccharomycopsis crataegensis]|uniref:Alpha-1,2-mannosyltransferase n=1 Tax=Saccharomycopsis crataegensis TaxID=43959 RepID=A0AAV5QGE8_9ASCO|nr:alpha-1,2-mannosyltransferase [Saccharomycopsis crataegensis]